MELAVVLMSLTEEERDALPGSATALSRRFSDDQISNAFSQLRLHNFVYHDFVLSQDFRALSQVRLQFMAIHPFFCVLQLQLHFQSHCIEDPDYKWDSGSLGHLWTAISPSL